MFIADPTYWMGLAFDEALLAIGTSRPNPPVGAILVREGQVVGRGRTQKPGNHHAEIMALHDAGERAQGADMYVTLEPCCFFGRTPPCTDAILAAQVGRVFISVIDQNPRVNGGGIARLQEAGIPVKTDVLSEFGTEFYRGYHHHLHTGLPWVDLKIAQSLDGFIAGPKG
ncbi:MAG TPA: bifunctional diaminohydroxyphosphoribosylaminopyrimidine deaminase/5-amino-6-(5-phosphoribosylamino)uracil reductase RibD, partial [Fibrobacteraceae bacterium]|nr:bifunctional diaminohydroxyphosphoribosylaminopyrimidine deaminase/5-amino-6-(5-phosphoribosylamino)uracil reductase RibD [Fibrobacteraceae bacterium]